MSIAPTFALTFGGFGDITTLCQIIASTCRILADCKNATKECQESLSYLIQFNNALTSLCTSLAHAPSSVRNGINDAARKCQAAIDDFRKRVSLPSDICATGFSGWLQGVKSSFVWTALHSTEASSLRAKLEAQRAVIDLYFKTYMAQQMTDLVALVNCRSIDRPLASDGVCLIDMLDQEVTVSLEFCYDYEMFQKFLKLFFSNRAGCKFVERGTYDLVIRSSGAGELLTPGNFRKLVKCGAVIEMAVKVRILKGSTPNAPAKCLKCGFSNSIGMVGRGTLKCAYCQTCTMQTRHERPVGVDITRYNDIILESEAESERDWAFMRRIHFQIVVIPPWISPSRAFPIAERRSGFAGYELRRKVRAGLRPLGRGWCF